MGRWELGGPVKSGPLDGAEGEAERGDVRVHGW